ncbi:MAG: hypothetical protein UY48_C0006G0025 [Candidatus Gottesmanbacteria bacterium GW2011_GWB1_49_7]|uniref:Uncharacterized protein n=1 Tax=Candidatus Gottesmanbacteria bacterium GW2011_GWB1_49_7 TaxID=1618448 RepID=A0A0G1YDB3_9BACT|nr:MAG: hypothetical protein UY48_C0006G0025 [Candidatus Gottesmanbacteria bacterium GW2011_GWB1_49_7]
MPGTPIKAHFNSLSVIGVDQEYPNKNLTFLLLRRYTEARRFKASAITDSFQLVPGTIVFLPSERTSR